MNEKKSDLEKTLEQLRENGERGALGPIVLLESGGRNEILSMIEVVKRYGYTINTFAPITSDREPGPVVVVQWFALLEKINQVPILEKK